MLFSAAELGSTGDLGAGGRVDPAGTGISVPAGAVEGVTGVGLASGTRGSAGCSDRLGAGFCTCVGELGGCAPGGDCAPKATADSPAKIEDKSSLNGERYMVLCMHLCSRVGCKRELTRQPNPYYDSAIE